MAAPLLKPSIHLSDATAAVNIATLNAMLDVIGAAMDSGTRDPGDTINGYGGGAGTPAWGPSDTLYAAHGPGATGTDWLTAYAGTAAIPADPAETQIAPTTTITAALGIAGELQKLRGTLAQLLQGSIFIPYTTNVSSMLLAQLNPGIPQTGSISLASNKSVTAGMLVSTAGAGTAPVTATSTTQCPNLTAQYLGDFQTGGGHSATTFYGSSLYAGMVGVLNSTGLYDTALIGADSAETATWDVLGAASTLINSLDRVRYVLSEWSVAANAGGAWSAVPSALTQSLTFSGPGLLATTLSGAVAVAAGGGLQATITGQTVTLSVAGVPVLNVPGTTATTATAGTNGDVPAAVALYLNVSLGSNSYKIPLYLP